MEGELQPTMSMSMDSECEWVNGERLMKFTGCLHVSSGVWGNVSIGSQQVDSSSLGLSARVEANTTIQSYLMNEKG